MTAKKRTPEELYNLALNRMPMIKSLKEYLKENSYSTSFEINFTTVTSKELIYLVNYDEEYNIQSIYPVHIADIKNIIYALVNASENAYINYIKEKIDANTTQETE